MLQEFHERAKDDGRPCHATYILSGYIEESILPVPGSSEAMQIDTDDFPMSSAPMTTQDSSQSNGSAIKPILSITLADEKDVKGSTSVDEV
jgi:hypothetical protein